MSKIPRVPVEELRVGEIVLGRDAAKYVSRVLRLRHGDSLELFDPIRVTRGLAKIVASDDRTVACMVEEVVAETSVPGYRIWLVLGMSKGERVERVIRDTTALGIARISVVENERSVLGINAEKLKRWRRLAVEASRQSLRGNVPEIGSGGSLHELLAALPNRAEREGSAPEEELRVSLLPEAARVFPSLISGWNLRAPVILAVGPEGGFSEKEVQLLDQYGFQSASLGNLILRTELAPVVAVSQLVGCWFGGERGTGV